ncbi:MAG TPA: hypothetical protein VFG20_05900 [Planctomycetaceae bacterium]|nr:hypothetical protein [Planctomycetaceae bacterium]
MAELEGSPQTWPPLGMPTGSVRALLTLIVVAVVVMNLATGRDLDVIWVETLLMALAHYFTSRRFVELPKDVRLKLERDGILEEEQHPLFLPKHSIRLVLLASFAGLAAYLYRENRLWEPRAATLLGMIFAYLLGSLLRGFGRWWNRGRTTPPSRFWGDAKALVVLTMVGAVALCEFTGMRDILDDRVHKVALGLLLFYFGSR